MKILPSLVITLTIACFTSLHAADTASPTAAATEELLKAMHVDQTVSAAIEKKKEAVINSMAALIPKDAPPEVRKELEDKQAAVVDATFKQVTWDSVKGDYIQAYGAFSEQELKEITAFLQTPAGQKFLEKVPDLQAKNMQILQKHMAGNATDMKKAAVQPAKPKASAAPSASPSATPKEKAAGKKSKASPSPASDASSEKH